MKTFFQLSLFLLLSMALHAQQYYFAYVQTDNKQPFYVKVNDKLFSSSASGYVVIPKLISGNYTLTFGFPKEQFPQQTINLNIAAADAGFLLKDFGAKADCTIIKPHGYNPLEFDGACTNYYINKNNAAPTPP